MVAWIILAVVIVLAIVVLAIVAVTYTNELEELRRQQRDRDNRAVKQCTAKQAAQLSEQERRISSSKLELMRLEGQINTAKQELVNANNQLSTAKREVATQKDWYKAVENDANKKIQDAQQQYDDLIKKGQEQHNDLVNKGQLQYDDLVSKGQAQYNELLEKGVKDADTKVKDCEVLLDKNKTIKEQELEKVLERLQSDINNRVAIIKEVESKLEELQERYNKGIKLEECSDDSIEYQYEFAPGEEEFFAVLRKLQHEWKEYAGDFGKIIWGRVMKQIQGWDKTGGNKVLHVKGVYRLVLKSDPQCVYIGQAKDVYGRWQEHMKKMCGVTAHGNEKLYKFNVEDFTWSVLESGNIDLDKSEAYWIDFYKSDQCGLNSKKGNRN